MEKSILLVDDEEGIRKVLGIALSDMGYHVRTAENGVEALRIFEDERPPIVLTDIKMPEMDGKQLLKHLQSVNPDIPFIFSSAFLDEESVKFGLSHGAYGVLTKPFNEVEMLFMVQSAVAFYKSQGLVRKSLKFLFFFLSQSGNGNGKNKELLENEIKNLIAEMDAIKSAA